MDSAGSPPSAVDVSTSWNAVEAPLLLLSLGPEAPSRVAFSRGACTGNQAWSYDDVKEERRRHLISLLGTTCYCVVPPVPHSRNKTGSKKIEVPWARPGTGFTQLFEALVMALARQIPVRTAAAILGTSDPRLWLLVDGRGAPRVPRLCAGGGQTIQGEPGRREPDLLHLFQHLDVSFVTPTKAGVSVRAIADQVTVNKEPAGHPGFASSDLSVTLILAALAALARAAITYEHFRSIKVQHDALGRVSPEEGMLSPGRSRAPPGTV